MAEKKERAHSSRRTKRYALQLSRKGIGLWGFIILGIAAWMFTLGILVGRGTAPLRFDIETLQKELAALKKASLKQEQKRYKIDKNYLENKLELPFYEALKLNTEEISLPAAKEGEPPQAEAPPKNLEKPEPTVDSPKTDPGPPKTAGNGGRKLTVQVASVKDPKDADKLVDRLKRKGFPAYRLIAKVPGKGIWFRVRVGPFEDRTTADVVLDRLNKEKYGGFIINTPQEIP